MSAKSTEELEEILNKARTDNTSDYLNDNYESMLNSDRPFAEYMRKLIKEKNLQQQNVFIDADIPDRNGYKLLSEEKHTKQRDVILRLCYAAELTLGETQRALKIYGLPVLYAKVPRDAVLMIAFNNRPGSVYDVNEYLESYGMDGLKPCGSQE